MVDKPSGGLVTAAIPKALAERIEHEVLEQGTYQSLTTFVAEAVRRRLEQLDSARV